MPLILGANSVSGYTVKNSLRFNSGSSDNLSRTFGTATSRRIFTISTWVKRSNLGTVQNIFTGGTGSGDAGIKFRSTDDLQFSEISSPYSAYNYEFNTSQVFRDVSAWYHILVAFDSTQATNTNRVKLYVNGSQVTAFAVASYPSQNYDSHLNNSVTHRISGAVDTTFGTRYFDGYVSETYFIDGQALTPSSFGETDTDTGIWKPKAYTGTFGTNGFYLKFANSASLGTDSSGNGNTFTVNNLTSVDQTTDTPTNNFATGNPLIGSNSGTLTEGNLTIANSTAAWKFFLSTQAVNKGKWYAEFRLSQITSYCHVGIMSTEDWEKQVTGYPYFGDTANSWSYNSTNGVRNNNITIDNESTYTTNDIISIGLDCDNSKVYFAKNGTWINSANPVTNTNGYSITASTNYYLGNMVYQATLDANFGSPMHSANSYSDGAGFGNFSYQVPSGYYALCTKNLANFG